jgi:FtsH-binding integral membrane protein
MRMMRNFARWRFIALFFLLALIHMTAGFSVMLYVDTGAAPFLTAGQYAGTGALALTICAVVFVLVSAHTYSQNDINEEAKAQSVLLQSLRLVCKKCGNFNTLVPNCLKCGEPTGYVEETAAS